MLILNHCSSKDITSLGQEFRNHYHQRLNSFEETAQVCVQKIYEEFRAPDNKPLFVLVRIFRFGLHDDLSPELKEKAKADSRYWLALMGTIGSEPDWCDRRKSKGHQVIPADSPVTPMLQAAFAQIGLQFGQAIDKPFLKNPEALEGSGRLGYFHVPVALNSPYIPDQDFVKTYHIQSVIGIGSEFLGNSAQMTICFGRHPISAEKAEVFAFFNPYMSTLLAVHNDHLWM